MTKTELVKRVAEESGLTRRQAEKAVNSILNGIGIGLKENGKVQLSGFGSFEVKERSARRGRNPRTGEEIEIPASKAASFRPYSQLKELIS